MMDGRIIECGFNIPLTYKCHKKESAVFSLKQGKSKRRLDYGYDGKRLSVHACMFNDKYLELPVFG